jgi:hypothetical protein
MKYLISDILYLASLGWFVYFTLQVLKKLDIIISENRKK